MKFLKKSKRMVLFSKIFRRWKLNLKIHSDCTISKYGFCSCKDFANPCKKSLKKTYRKKWTASLCQIPWLLWTMSNWEVFSSLRIQWQELDKTENCDWSTAYIICSDKNKEAYVTGLGSWPISAMKSGIVLVSGGFCQCLLFALDLKLTEGYLEQIRKMKRHELNKYISKC